MAKAETVLPNSDIDERRDPSAENKYRRSIYGLPVTVTISIGQKRLSVAELLELRPESIVPLTCRVDDPVDLMIDDKVIAKGDLIETEDGVLAIKLTEIQEQDNDN